MTSWRDRNACIGNSTNGFYVTTFSWTATTWDHIRTISVTFDSLHFRLIRFYKPGYFALLSDQYSACFISWLTRLLPLQPVRSVWDRTAELDGARRWPAPLTPVAVRTTLPSRALAPAAKHSPEVHLSSPTLFSFSNLTFCLNVNEKIFSCRACQVKQTNFTWFPYWYSW